MYLVTCDRMGMVNPIYKVRRCIPITDKREKAIKNLEQEVLRLTDEILRLKAQLRNDQALYSFAQAMERLELYRVAQELPTHTVIDIYAIGPRKDSLAYKVALKRKDW